MFDCPHCKQPGIPVFRKAILSPGLLATCSACAGESSLRYKSWLTAMIPGTLLMIAGMFADTAAVEWTLSIIGLVLMILVPMRYAPLHRCDRKGVYLD